MTEIEKLKLMPGISGSNEMLELVLESAEDDFMQYCGLQEVPESAKSLIRDMAVIRYNRIGVEGLSSQSWGASQSFIDGYPADIRARLNRYRRIKVL